MAVLIKSPSSRRRRFIILVIICTMSFIIFTFYARTEDLKSFSSIFSSNFIDKTNPHIHVVNSEGTDLTRASRDRAKSRQSQLKGKDDDAKDSENAKAQMQKDAKTEHAVQTEKVKLAPVSKKDEDDDFVVTMPSKNFELENSGPTEDDFVVTMPSKNFELENSGPTEDDDFLVTMPSKNFELENSGPTEDDDFVVTMPSRDFELENSGPTEENEVKAVTMSIFPSTTQKAKLSLTATTPTAEMVTNPVKTAGLILDTPACKVPKLDPWDPTVKNLIQLTEPYECPGPPLFIRSTPDGAIALNESILTEHYSLKASDIDCTYTTYHRKHEDPGNVRENDYTIGKTKPLQFGIPLKEDYIAVRCKLGSDDFEHLFPLVNIKEEIEKSRDAIPLPKPVLNVILLGIDSVSKLNFLRHFPRTHKILKEKLSPFTMNGYTKVGDNTFPNLVPMLTGRFVEHFWNESLRDTMYFDDVDLVWKAYAKRGYRTFYAEDSPLTGTFNYLKRGFYDPPTDYYLRPLVLALENSNVRKNSKKHCYNSELETEVIYNFLRDFVKAMDARPYTAFAMVSTLTHDYLNNAGYADLPAANILDDLLKDGALNKSMMVIFSDHGLRFGKIRETYLGKFEERMPFMYIHFPKWFLDMYPEFSNNLRLNQNRLMTLFDIHATMMHLLNLSQSSEEIAEVSQGASLLYELSPNRTCSEANILPHWCPCQTFQNVSLDDKVAIGASKALVDHINSELKVYNGLCSTLEIDKVLDVRLGQANDLVLRFIRHDNVVVDRKVVYGKRLEPIGDYLVTLIVKPGGAVFEGTIRHDPAFDTYSVLGISRINMYGKTSWCIDSQKMKIYCYCAKQLDS